MNKVKNQSEKNQGIYRSLLPITVIAKLYGFSATTASQKGYAKFSKIKYYIYRTYNLIILLYYIAIIFITTHLIDPKPYIVLGYSTQVAIATGGNNICLLTFIVVAVSLVLIFRQKSENITSFYQQVEKIDALLNKLEQNIEYNKLFWVNVIVVIATVASIFILAASTVIFTLPLQHAPFLLLLFIITYVMTVFYCYVLELLTQIMHVREVTVRFEKVNLCFVR